MILKLSALRVVAFVQCSSARRRVQRLLPLRGHWVPKTCFSQRNQAAITSS